MAFDAACPPSAKAGGWRRLYGWPRCSLLDCDRRCGGGSPPSVTPFSHTCPKSRNRELKTLLVLHRRFAASASQRNPSPLKEPLQRVADGHYRHKSVRSASTAYRFSIAAARSLLSTPAPVPKLGERTRSLPSIRPPADRGCSRWPGMRRRWLIGVRCGG